MWKTYKEAYDEVLQIASALRASGAKAVSLGKRVNSLAMSVRLGGFSRYR